MKENIKNVVAVVEDDEQVLDAIGLILEANGMKTVLFQNGEDFVAALHELQLKTLLLDPHLPGINGSEVLTQLRLKHNKDSVKVIVVTANPNSDETKKLRAAGVDQILLKPISEETLFSAVNESSYN